uniref:Uncharacterized protein n=1 Tax=Anguilla anguilla TaxID=7936 RepID=A0A0E9SS42_ANGAN
MGSLLSGNRIRRHDKPQMHGVVMVGIEGRGVEWQRGKVLI